jgi:hypothetical protein
MNYWQKGALFGAVIAAGVYALAFIPVDPKKDFGQYAIPADAAKICISCLLPSLIAGWVYERWISKGSRSVFPPLVAVCVSIILFSLIVRVKLGGWFWHEPLWILGFPTIMCGIPIAYVTYCIRRSNEKPREKTA